MFLGSAQSPTVALTGQYRENLLGSLLLLITTESPLINHLERYDFDTEDNYHNFH